MQCCTVEKGSAAERTHINANTHQSMHFCRIPDISSPFGVNGMTTSKMATNVCNHVFVLRSPTICGLFLWRNWKRWCVDDLHHLKTHLSHFISQNAKIKSQFAASFMWYTDWLSEHGGLWPRELFINLLFLVLAGSFKPKCQSLLMLFRLSFLPDKSMLLLINQSIYCTVKAFGVHR